LWYEILWPIGDGLTPEEAGLILSGLGYDHRTFSFVAGSQMPRHLTRLVTKEDILPPMSSPRSRTSFHGQRFKSFSLARQLLSLNLTITDDHLSQLAALDFIACASSDVFAVTDSGSQLYHGRGRAPTLHPNRKHKVQDKKTVFPLFPIFR
jgi:hypothetical protein